MTILRAQSGQSKTMSPVVIKLSFKLKFSITGYKTNAVAGYFNESILCHLSIEDTNLKYQGLFFMYAR